MAGLIPPVAIYPPDLQRAIVELANALRRFHYDRDGCLDDDEDDDEWDSSARTAARS